jgi:hypothetical protein
MDYYEGVVMEYLRAEPNVFVNTQCNLQLVPGAENYWTCDLIAVDLRQKAAFLCEVTYSESMGALLKKLRAWHSQWPAVRNAVTRDCAIPENWDIRPWLFVREDRRAFLDTKLAEIAASPGSMPEPLVTTLDMVVPWRYRYGEDGKLRFEHRPTLADLSLVAKDRAR